MSERRGMKERRNSSGFTLIELIVATALSGIILMGMFSLLTNMVSAEINGMRGGAVTAWSLAGINVMNKDIAGASYISHPLSGASDDTLIVCTNWSAVALPGPPPAPGLVNSLAPNPVNAVYYYCYDAADTAPPFAKALLRKVVTNSGAGACPAVAPACTSANYPGDSIVTAGVYYDPTAPPGSHIFTADPNTMNAVRLRFVVGNPAGNAVSAVPVSVAFNTEIILED